MTSSCASGLSVLQCGQSRRKRLSRIATLPASVDRPAKAATGRNADGALANVLIMFYIAPMRDEPTVPPALRRPRPRRRQQCDRPVRGADAGGGRRRLGRSPRRAALLRTEVTIERPRSAIIAQRLARSAVRPLDQPLSRLRAWLHLLFRAAQPRLSRPVAGARFRDPADRAARAPEVLARELSARRYRPATIAIGTNTDPYQPIEGDHGIMRGAA